MHTMPIDPSISLNVQQFDPMASYGKALSLKTLMGQQQLQGLQIDQAEREQRDALKMAEVFKRNINPDGSLNRTKLIQETADAGLGNKIPGMQKQWNEADKADADLRYTNSKTKDIDFGLLKKRLGATNGALASLLSRRDFTYQDVLAQVNRLVDDKVITPEEGATVVRDIPDRPDLLRPYLVQKGIEGLETEKRLELLTPKLERVNNGKTTSFVDTNKWTNPDGPAPIRMTTTPGEDQSAATSRRGQNMTDARAREGNDIARKAARTQVVETPDGYALVDKGTGLVRPAATMSGARVSGKDSGLNDSQSKALLFGSRMQAANKILDSMASQGVDQPGLIKRAVGSVPLIGDGLGTMVNGTQSAQQQQVEQAQRDFINAVLRRESGAVIASSEFDSATRQYFPQPGDSGAVKKQKAMNRQLAIRGLMAEVPAGKAAKFNSEAQPPASKPAALPGGWSVTEH